ncbi:hypothetical protein PXK30_02955 [Phaeobacter gallaeciensis]|uniref:hypothetical protein n=1 Tax=Rhodobacterales TaxID=204455 RepID=UPI00237F62F1|nr:hypothetical protein [Phaeobacter gallaeciensis]MDE4303870.1 hypothetical protein [Phaeobacter gallaeciensis]MDE4308929.1 hypothetical protein [Phaeobacter gallaeciensis]MDE4313517.1 hypothetical protein [Phaeobacter gallaeciensis]MDE4317858.1 hypothetical protein [Phaeobacter gallaeciensis]MDE4322321.1 hypothetical protein [Phaeobacter gallaeciensis]
MIWTTKTHELAATTCQHTGASCPALERMLVALCGALDTARDMTEEDFEITGDSLLDGCTRHCPARFFASHDRIRVFCEVDTAAERSGLDRFADALLSSDPQAQPADHLPHRPCSFGEAIPLSAA